MQIRGAKVAKAPKYAWIVETVVNIAVADRSAAPSAKWACVVQGLLAIDSPHPVYPDCIYCSRGSEYPLQWQIEVVHINPYKLYIHVVKYTLYDIVVMFVCVPVTHLR